MRRLLVLVVGAMTLTIGGPTVGRPLAQPGPLSEPPTTAPAGKHLSALEAADVTGAPSEDVRPAGVAGGYVFVPINPFRALDSRLASNGFVVGGNSLYFDVLTDINGAKQLPDETVAVTFNLAIDGTLGSGFLGVFPADISWPGNATINWTTSGTTLSNGGTVAVGFFDAPGQVAVYAGPALPIGTYFIMDITGYYI